MSRSLLQRHGRQAFTLTELLVVIAIMGLLAAISIPSLSKSGSGRFNQSIEAIAGILDQARSYAVAHDTYVWVAFYPLDPSKLSGGDTDQGGDELYVGVYASTDGTDPVQWGTDLTVVPIPYSTPPGITPSIIQISKVSVFKQLHLETENYFASAQIPALPSTLGTPTPPLSLVSFSLPLHSPAITLSNQPLPSGESGKTLVVGFTPSGSAQVSSSMESYIGLDFQPMKATGIKDTANLAALRISGLIGLTTIYRK